jgi:hypothetical protein
MQRINKKAGLALVVAAGLLPCAAQAQMPDFSDVKVSIVAKAWNNSWTTWFNEIQLTDAAIAGSNLVVRSAALNIYNRESENRETVFIPQISVRTGPWSLNGSAFTKKTYTFALNETNAAEDQLTQASLERKEYDVNVAYNLSPNFAVALGYKDWRNNSTVSGYKFEGKGPTFGVVANGPVWGALNFYGSFAYGIPKVKSTFSVNPLLGNADSASDGRGKYLLGEVGLYYPLGSMNDSLTGFGLTGGYRYQKMQSGQVELNTVSLVTGALIGTRSTRLTDITEGFTLALVYSF